MQSDVDYFQNDRGHAIVPPALKAADAQLAAALSQYLTGFSELNVAQTPAQAAEAGTKLNAADAAFATALTQLASALGAQSPPV
jgi:outer membrane protein TolC